MRKALTLRRKGEYATMTSMLTDEQKTAFASKLEKEKGVLEEQLGHLGSRDPSNPGDWIASKPEGEEFGADRTDNAGVIEEMFGNNASMNELEYRLKNVNAAIERIQAGTFGVCEISGHDIEVERLEANPAARTCKEHMQEEKKLG